MSITNNLDLLFEQFENESLESGTNKIKDLEDKPLLIYGAGNVGRRLQKILSENNLNVLGFLDRNRDLKSLSFEVPCFHPESINDLKYKEAVVIIAGLFDQQIQNEIKSYLSSLGFIHSCQLNEVDLSRYTKHHYYENSAGTESRRLNILKDEKTNIYKAFDLLHGEKDKRCFIAYIKAHLCFDFCRLPNPDDLENQYLANDIHHDKNYSNFIDCGGYNGDTVRNILCHDHIIDNMVIFEPNQALFHKIVSYIKEDPKRFKSATVFPCGVYSGTKQLAFSFAGHDASTGHIDPAASDIIQCVKIDDILHGFNPTFIKMDIEGAELEALRGAEQTIKENRPQLAICVYHCLSHIWDIPLLIDDLHKGYDYYLRTYNEMTMETVLYAFPDSTT